MSAPFAPAAVAPVRLCPFYMSQCLMYHHESCCVNPVGACTSQSASIDQFDRLLFITVSPVVFLLVLFTGHLIMPRLVRCLHPGLGPSESSQRCSTYRSLAYKAGLVMLFTIYPGISTEIVKSFR